MKRATLMLGVITFAMTAQKPSFVHAAGTCQFINGKYIKIL